MPGRPQSAQSTRSDRGPGLSKCVSGCECDNMRQGCASGVCPHRCLGAYPLLSVPSSPSGSHPPGTARPFSISFPLPLDSPSSSEHSEGRQAPPGTTATSYKLGEHVAFEPQFIHLYNGDKIAPTLGGWWETSRRANNKIQAKNSAAK